MKETLAETKTGVLARLQEKWKLESALQVVIVLLVFSLTGSTVVMIRKAFFAWMGFDATTSLWLKTFAYIAFIMPAYQILLLGYGALFGQFSFFWRKEKKLFAKIKKVLVREK